jgi:hypothetical protein
MNFDLRYPIGIMFSVFGAMLVVFGLASETKLYERSLGINVNLWWGLVLLIFGATMFVMAWRAGRAKESAAKPGQPPAATNGR